MKVKNIIVPWDKFTFMLLAKMQAQEEKSWIFIHSSAVSILKASNPSQEKIINGNLVLLWEETKEFSQIAIALYSFSREWSLVKGIRSENIKFTEPSDNPEKLLFVKMEKSK